MTIISTAELKKGVCVIFRNEPHVVVDRTFVSPGKGSAFYRTKLRNIATGQVTDSTFKSGEKLEEAPVEVRQLQYLYRAGDELTFVDPQSFDQLILPLELVNDFIILMKEGESYQVYVLDGKAIALRLPLKVKLAVVRAEAGAKGNTVSGATKEVELETGLKLQVPLFIKEGNTVTVNVENQSYVERA